MQLRRQRNPQLLIGDGDSAEIQATGSVCGGRRQSFQKPVGQSGDPPPPQENPTDAAQPRDWRRGETAAAAVLRRRHFRPEREQRQEKRAGQGEGVVGEEQAEGSVRFVASAVGGVGFRECERSVAAPRRRVQGRRRTLAPAAVGDFPAAAAVEESLAAGARRNSGVTPATVCRERLD